MEIAKVGNNVTNNLAFQQYLKAEYSVCGWMLRTQVDYHFLFPKPIFAVFSRF
jgi:hypothetical protein